MPAKLVFLGQLQDIAGMPERHVAPGPLAALVAALEPGLAAAVRGPRVRIALNGVVLGPDDDAIVGDGDELAFLPPVSGG